MRFALLLSLLVLAGCKRDLPPPPPKPATDLSAHGVKAKVVLPDGALVEKTRFTPEQQQTEIDAVQISAGDKRVLIRPVAEFSAESKLETWTHDLGEMKVLGKNEGPEGWTFSYATPDEAAPQYFFASFRKGAGVLCEAQLLPSKEHLKFAEDVCASIFPAQ